MPKRLPYDIEELRRLYFDEGLDCDAVAERVGMGTGKTVGEHLKKAGYELRASAPVAKDWPVAEIPRLYWDEGLASPDIAMRLQCGASTVRRVLYKNGGTRGRGRSAKDRSGRNCPSWKGGRVEANGGYVFLHMPYHPMASKHGYVAEHRLVMANALGRPLKSSELVHHINGIKNDNRPENLEIMCVVDHGKLHRDCWHELCALRQRVAQLETELERAKVQAHA